MIASAPAAAMAIVKAFVAVFTGELESVTSAVKLKEPDCVGVPEIVPELLLNVNPAGSEPLLTLHEYGVVPPVACKLAEYVTPTVPDGIDVVERESGGSGGGVLPFGALVTPAQPARPIHAANRIPKAPFARLFDGSHHEPASMIRIPFLNLAAMKPRPFRRALWYATSVEATTLIGLLSERPIGVQLAFRTRRGTDVQILDCYFFSGGTVRRCL